MLKKLALAVLVLAFSGAAGAATLDVNDSADYELLTPEHQPSGQLFHFFYKDGAWLMESKAPDGEWQRVNTSGKDTFRNATNKEMAGFLPDFNSLSAYRPACIINASMAFCRLTNPKNSREASYLLAYFGAGEPVLANLRRVN